MARIKNYVYEMEKGWSFDGNYIPHFLELNWYFGDNPTDFREVQKIRIHGLGKGRSFLQLSMAGMQTEYDSDYMRPQWFDLPRTAKYVLTDFVPENDVVDYAVRGLSTQIKIEGRNTDITRPEPSHVIQVLVIQSSPVGTGARAS